MAKFLDKISKLTRKALLTKSGRKSFLATSITFFNPLAGYLYFILSGESPLDLFKNLNVVNIAILGPNGAGKTTLWNFFRGLPTAQTSQQTDGKNFVSFKVSDRQWNATELKSIKNNYKYEGYDINGNSDFIRTDWEDLIQKSNMIIFVFNAYLYRKDKDYERDTNQRMQLIMKTIEKDMNQNKRGVWLIGSYADQLKDKVKDWNKIINDIKEKDYHKIAYNHACFDLTKEEELKQYYKKIFLN